MCAIGGIYRLPNAGNASVLPIAKQVFNAQVNRGSQGWGLNSLAIQSGTFYSHLSDKDAKDDYFLLGGINLLPEFETSAVLIQGRYPTEGASIVENLQPMQNDPEGKRPKEERFSIVFNGNIANVGELREKMKGLVTFKGTADTEVLMRLIEQIADKQTRRAGEPLNYKKIFSELEQQIDGGCSLCLMSANGACVAFRKAPGITPLWFGQKEGVLMFASETSAFEGLTKDFHEVPPGQIVWYNPERNDVSHHFVAHKPDSRLAAIENTKPKLNVIEAVYIQNSSSQIYGQSNYKTRRNIGRGMANHMASLITQIPADERKNIRIIAVPNSGIPYAKGFSEGMERLGLVPAVALLEGIQRRRMPSKPQTISLNRAFQGSDRADRLKRAEIKHHVIHDNVEGKSVWVCDDTLVRSDTSRVITRKLLEADVAEIHWVIGSPPIIGSDYYGISIPSLEELAFWEIWQQSTPNERSQLYQRGKDGHAAINLELLEKKLSEKMTATVIEDLMHKGHPVPENIRITVHYTPLDILNAALAGGPELYAEHAFTSHYPTRKGQERFDNNLAQVMRLAL